MSLLGVTMSGQESPTESLVRAKDSQSPGPALSEKEVNELLEFEEEDVNEELVGASPSISLSEQGLAFTWQNSSFSNWCGHVTCSLIILVLSTLRGCLHCKD